MTPRHKKYSSFKHCRQGVIKSLSDMLRGLRNGTLQRNPVEGDEDEEEEEVLVSEDEE